MKAQEAHQKTILIDMEKVDASDKLGVMTGDKENGPTGAATRLGVPRQTLESKIRKLGINRHRFKTS